MLSAADVADVADATAAADAPPPFAWTYNLYAHEFLITSS